MARFRQRDTAAPWSPAPAAPAGAPTPAPKSAPAAAAPTPAAAPAPADAPAPAPAAAAAPAHPDAAPAGPAIGAFIDSPVAGEYLPQQRREPDGRQRAVGVAAVRPQPGDIVPAEIYQVSLPGRRASAVGGTAFAEPAFVARIPTSTPVRPRPGTGRPVVGRRLLVALATAVALAALTTVGLGYVAFTHPGDSSQALLPTIPGTPTIDPTPPRSMPDADPRAGIPTTPPTGTPRTRTTPGAAAPASTAPAAPAAGSPADGTAARESSPAASADPAAASTLIQRPEPPAPSPTSAPLTATLSSAAGRTTGALTDYVGTIRIDNPRLTTASSWRLTLTVPGGNKVAARGSVAVTQSGESVTFTPANGATIAAGDSLTFTFTIAGVLTAPPTTCTLDGHTCS